MEHYIIIETSRRMFSKIDLGSRSSLETAQNQIELFAKIYFQKNNNIGT